MTLTLLAAFAERFWAKVDMSGGLDACWPWTGATTEKRGGAHYGQVRLPRSTGGARVGAHRVALALSLDGVLPELDAGHTVCDNSICCNPRHLAWQTHQENMQEYARKYGAIGRPKWMGPEPKRHALLELTEA